MSDNMNTETGEITEESVVEGLEARAVEALQELGEDGGLTTKKLVAAGVLVVALIGVGVSFWRMKKAKADVIEINPVPADDIQA